MTKNSERGAENCSSGVGARLDEDRDVRAFLLGRERLIIEASVEIAGDGLLLKLSTWVCERCRAARWLRMNEVMDTPQLTYTALSDMPTFSFYSAFAVFFCMKSQIRLYILGSHSFLKNSIVHY